MQEQTRQVFMRDYGESCGREVLLLSPFFPGVTGKRSDRLPLRDRLVVELADTLLPVAIRPGGTLSALITERVYAGAQVVPLEPEPASGGPIELSPSDSDIEDRGAKNVESPAPAIKKFAEEADARRFLIHYTRACVGPWPGQKPLEYARELLENPGIQRNALLSLIRILEERTLRASSALTRGGFGVVSFTECAPRDITGLMTRRVGLMRPAFEPYGIALERDTLFASGARPVIYSVPSAFQDLNDDLRHLYQADSGKKHDWTTEKEWRVKGDLSIDDTMWRGMITITPTQNEAAYLRDRFHCRSAVFDAVLHAYGTPCVRGDCS
jgi:hypothetical protein